MVKVFNIIHSAMQKIKLRSRLILAFSFLTMTLFLASINSCSAELNFWSTPFPLMGFHG
jgi:hypothetical protein